MKRKYSRRFIRKKKEGLGRVGISKDVRDWLSCSTLPEVGGRLKELHAGNVLWKVYL